MLKRWFAVLLAAVALVLSVGGVRPLDADGVFCVWAEVCNVTPETSSCSQEWICAD